MIGKVFVVRLPLELIMARDMDHRGERVKPNAKQVYGTTPVSLSYVGYSDHVRNENTPIRVEHALWG